MNKEEEKVYHSQSPSGIENEEELNNPMEEDPSLLDTEQGKEVYHSQFPTPFGVEEVYPCSIPGKEDSFSSSDGSDDDDFSMLYGGAVVVQQDVLDRMDSVETKEIKRTSNAQWITLLTNMVVFTLVSSLYVGLILNMRFISTSPFGGSGWPFGLPVIPNEYHYTLLKRGQLRNTSSAWVTVEMLQNATLPAVDMESNIYPHGRTIPLHSVVETLKGYLSLSKSSGDYTCMCMHHLNDSLPRPFRICGVKTATKTPIIMINPMITGGTIGKEDEVDVMEHSLMCPSSTSHSNRLGMGDGFVKSRKDIVFVTWIHWASTGGGGGGGMTVFNEFQDEWAHCLQMVLEEADNQYDCS